MGERIGVGRGLDEEGHVVRARGDLKPQPAERGKGVRQGTGQGETLGSLGEGGGKQVEEARPTPSALDAWGFAARRVGMREQEAR